MSRKKVTRATTFHLDRILDLLTEMRDEKPVTFSQIRDLCNFRFGGGTEVLTDALIHLVKRGEVRKFKDASSNIWRYHIIRTGTPRAMEIKQGEKFMEKEEKEEMKGDTDREAI